MKQRNRDMLEKIFKDEYHDYMRSVARASMRMDQVSPMLRLEECLQSIVGHKRVRTIKTEIQRAVRREEEARQNQLVIPGC